MPRRIHDMGGVSGFGAVEIEENEPVFHERWEGRVFGIFSLAGLLGLSNLDRSRAAIESQDRESYLRLGYYGRWLEAVARILEEDGLLDTGELDERTAALRSGARPVAAAACSLPPATADDSLTARRTVATAPRYAVGQKVRARDIEPCGHTRLPGYVRGCCGVVVAHYAGWVFPDTHARGDGEQPQHVYCVRFDAQELWGAQAEDRAAMHVDLFESYLEPSAD